MQVNDLADDGEAERIWQTHLDRAAERLGSGTDSDEIDAAANFPTVSELADELAGRFPGEWREDVAPMRPEAIGDAIYEEGDEWLVELYQRVVDEDPRA